MQSFWDFMRPKMRAEDFWAKKSALFNLHITIMTKYS